MYTITKKFSISCSHRLIDVEISEEENKKIFGKCFNLPAHGHNYTIILYLKSKTLKHGMVLNFNEVKRIFMEEIDDKFDHHHLNDLMDTITTAENMCKLFYDILKKQLKQLYKVRIFETDTSYAEYEE